MSSQAAIPSRICVARFAGIVLLSLVLGSALLVAWWQGITRTPRQVDWSGARRSTAHLLPGAEARLPQVPDRDPYTFMRVVYWDTLALLAPLAIWRGLGLIYRRWPDLWGVILSHAVLGSISIKVGLV